MPGTENSESNADKDAQEQLWDDTKVLTGKGKGYTHTLVTIHVNNFRFAAHGYVFSLG